MLRLFLAAALALPLVAAGCGTPRPTTTPTASSGQAPAQAEPPAHGRPFELARGESATLEELTVTFASVLEDSRCPVDVTCVWEGRATVNLAVDYAGRTGGVNLEIAGGASEGTPADALGHRFVLRGLSPYPGSAEAEAGAAPTVTLLVERLTR